MDGYFREYGGALVRLSEIQNSKSLEELKHEFSQGVAAHPSHLRVNLDFDRKYWLNIIKDYINSRAAVIVKGVSGQGKTALCYRYLINHYPEEFVFCIRHIQSFGQAENLVKAILGISKHCKDIVLFIDVNPGEYHWTWLLRELQTRGMTIPVLISIREEDFKLSNVDRSEVTFKTVELTLKEDEAKNIFEVLSKDTPNDSFRVFEEAWEKFGRLGPFLEFIYLLNNSETLKQRLETQIERLMREPQCNDGWLSLLCVVSYAGIIGCPVLEDKVRNLVNCTNFIAALTRMSEEYLLRTSEDGRHIEALHPLRAKIIYEILRQQILFYEKEILLQVLKCSKSNNYKLLLFRYYTNNLYEETLINEIAQIKI